MEDHTLNKLIQNYKKNPNNLKWFTDRLEEIYDEQDIYIMNMVDANIRVEWALLPSYQNFTMSITKAYKRKVHKVCGISDERFTKAETELIFENWNKLCQQYKLENKPKIFAQWKSRSLKRNAKVPVEITRRSVMALLAKGLHRTLQQVYRHFRSTVAYDRQGTYSAIEEVFMNICFQYCPNSITIPMMSYVMGREPRGLTKRFMLFTEKNMKGDNQKGEKAQFVQWNLDNVEKLIKGIMHHENVENYHQLQNRPIHSSTWRSVAEETGLSQERVNNMWYRKVHVQLFVEEDIYSSVVQNKVIRILRNSKYTMWREISWKRIARMLGDGYTGPFVNRLVQGLATKYCTDYLKKDLKEVCAELKKKRKIWKKHCQRLKGLRINSKHKLKFRKKRKNNEVLEYSNTFSDKENHCMQMGILDLINIDSETTRSKINDGDPYIRYNDSNKQYFNMIEYEDVIKLES